VLHIQLDFNSTNNIKIENLIKFRQLDFIQALNMWASLGFAYVV